MSTRQSDTTTTTSLQPSTVEYNYSNFITTITLNYLWTLTPDLESKRTVTLCCVTAVTGVASRTSEKRWHVNWFKLDFCEPQLCQWLQTVYEATANLVQSQTLKTIKQRRNSMEPWVEDPWTRHYKSTKGKMLECHMLWSDKELLVLISNHQRARKSKYYTGRIKLLRGEPISLQFLFLVLIGEKH